MILLFVLSFYSDCMRKIKQIIPFGNVFSQSMRQYFVLNTKNCSEM